jgi:uncharacterized protein YjcR
MRNRISEEIERKIVELYEKGMKDTEIGRSVGLTRNTVASWRKRTKRVSNYAPRRREVAAIEARGTINPNEEMMRFFNSVGATTHTERVFALRAHARAVGR